MRLHRSILGLLMTLVLIVCMSSSAVAEGINKVKLEQGDMNIWSNRAEMFLSSINHSSTVENPILLENLKGEYEAVVFSLKPIGYIIVNINDLTIPELSFQNQNPFQDSIHPIYNGPLGYYAKANKKIISLKDSSVLSMEKVDYIYSKPKIEHLKLVDPVSEESNQQSRSINVEKRLKGTLKTWYISGNNCGSIASAICMSFYRDYVNLHYVDNYHTGKDALIALMQQYVGVGETNYDDLVNGLIWYFKVRGIANSAVKTNGFIFSTVRNKISANRPVIVRTTKPSTYDEHWIIAHGYFESAVDGNYIIVNDGWRSNNVWIESNTSTLDGIIYFTN